MALLAASVASFKLVALLSIPNPIDFTDIILFVGVASFLHPLVSNPCRRVVMVVAVGLQRLPEEVLFVIIRRDKSSFSLSLLSSSEVVIIFVVASNFFFEFHSTSSKVAAAAVSLFFSSTSSIVLYLPEQLSKVTTASDYFYETLDFYYPKIFTHLSMLLATATAG